VLQITGGERPARLSVGVSERDDSMASLTTLLSVAGDAHVTGEQLLSSAGPIFPDPHAPSGFGPCLERSRGETTSARVSLLVPPRSSTTVTAVHTLAVPPGPAEDLSLAFDVRGDPVGPGEDAPAETRIALAGPELKVRRGVDIRFLVPRPRSGRPSDGTTAPPTFARGRRVPIRGTTSPALAGQRLRLVFARLRSSRSALIARVRVRRDGSFRYRHWVPPARGEYVVNAVYRAQAAGLATSRTRCGPTVRVR
jgi:hypothetical protein